MKKFVVGVMGVMLAGSVSLATDAQDSHDATVDTSKNPITGTQTVTKKYKKNQKAKNGASSEMEVTEKTKTKKNGKVEKEVEVEAESSN